MHEPALITEDATSGYSQAASNAKDAASFSGVADGVVIDAVVFGVVEPISFQLCKSFVVVDSGEVVTAVGYPGHRNS